MSGEDVVRVVLVDDQEMIRAGLRAILERHPQVEVVGEAGDGLAAQGVVDELVPDVVLMDIRMPGIDGVEATRRLRARHPASEVRIVVLTTFEHDETVLAALRLGANGFLSKGVGPAELVASIVDVARGGGALSAAAAAALIEHVAVEPFVPVDAAMAERFAALTPRELEVVQALVAGQDAASIAAQLFLSPFTVKTHANRAMTKVGARDRAQLVSFAVQAGHLPAPRP